MPSIPPYRGYAYALVSFIVFIWVMCAFGSNLGLVTNTAQVSPTTKIESRVWMDIWYRCSRSSVNDVDTVASCSSLTDSAIPCGAWKSRLQAVQAFYVFTGLMSIVCIAIGCMTQWGRIPSLPFGVPHKLLLIALAAWIVFWSLISWAVAISIPDGEFCKDDPAKAIGKFKSSPGFKWGASPFFMLIAFLFSIAMIVVAILVPQEGEPQPVPQQEVNAVPVVPGEAVAVEKQAWAGNEA